MLLFVSPSIEEVAFEKLSNRVSVVGTISVVGHLQQTVRAKSAKLHRKYFVLKSRDRSIP